LAGVSVRIGYIGLIVACCFLSSCQRSSYSTTSVQRKYVHTKQRVRGFKNTQKQTDINLKSVRLLIDRNLQQRERVALTVENHHKNNLLRRIDRRISLLRKHEQELLYYRESIVARFNDKKNKQQILKGDEKRFGTRLFAK
jgi:hypothetical protein